MTFCYSNAFFVFSATTAGVFFHLAPLSSPNPLGVASAFTEAADAVIRGRYGHVVFHHERYTTIVEC